MPIWTPDELDFNNDGGINLLDATWAQGILQAEGISDLTGSQWFLDFYDWLAGDTTQDFYTTATVPPELRGHATEGDASDEPPMTSLDTTQVSGISNLIGGGQFDAGASASAVGSKQELGRMLSSYQARKSLIQSPIRQKSVFTIDRFDGGLNLNKSARDIAYWEAIQLDELSPSKIGRLIRLGDLATADKTFNADDVNWGDSGNYKYGLEYFKLSNSINSSGNPESSGIPSNYVAVLDDDGSGDDASVHLVLTENNNKIDGLASSLNTGAKPVMHNADNRIYISNATFDNNSVM